MHPVSTAFFLLGYGLSLPIATRLAGVVSAQQRLALWGHQAGMILVAGGWFLKAQPLVAVGHLVWMAIAQIWFSLSGRNRSTSRAT